MQIEPILLVGLLLVGIIILAIAVSAKGGNDEWKPDLRRRANSIRNKVGRVDSVGKKQLLIEADKLLDHTLMNMKLPGRNLADRLKAARSKLDKSLYQQVWSAHKARNSLVHELDYKIDDDQVKAHIKSFIHAIDKLTT